jgi:dTDP-4-dehydrorhamnose 3,5-epimerase
MLFSETPLKGAHVIELEKRGDERGFFARMFCEEEFATHGLATRLVQANNSAAARRGTLRGCHYQLPPKAETKLVRCIRGALYDVIIDVRRDSPTFGDHFGVELTAENRKMLYVPKGFAHAFLTLEDATEAIYLVDEFYAPDHERGIRWNDPKFGIDWPIDPVVISDKDRNFPDFDTTYHLEP